MSTRAAPPSEPYDFGILLGLAYQDFVVALNANLAAAGFTAIRPGFGYVFRVLATGDTTASALAARLGITTQGTAKLLDEMEAAGYVERRADPDDARSKRVLLSGRGRRALAAARRFHHAFEKRLVAAHGARAMATLRALLEAVVAEGERDVAPGRRLLRHT